MNRRELQAHIEFLEERISQRLSKVELQFSQVKHSVEHQLKISAVLTGMIFGVSWLWSHRKIKSKSEKLKIEKNFWMQSVLIQLISHFAGKFLKKKS